MAQLAGLLCPPNPPAKQIGLFQTGLRSMHLQGASDVLCRCTSRSPFRCAIPRLIFPHQLCFVCEESSKSASLLEGWCCSLVVIDIHGLCRIAPIHHLSFSARNSAIKPPTSLFVASSLSLFDTKSVISLTLVRAVVLQFSSVSASTGTPPSLAI